MLITIFVMPGKGATHVAVLAVLAGTASDAAASSSSLQPQPQSASVQLPVAQLGFGVEASR
jgi:hypothetical protein